MLKHLLSGFAKIDLGIDLGTANTLVCVKGRGIVLSEPSVVAVAKGTRSVMLRGMAVGEVARQMVGKTPDSISAVRPLKDGVITDFDVTEAMLAYFIRKACNPRFGLRPRAAISVPSGITAVERRAVTNAAERAGARRVYLIAEPMAAAIGAGLPVEEPSASMIVDVGGGTTEVAVISLCGLVRSRCIKVGGDAMDEAIAQYMRTTYNLEIGAQTAERIKIQIGSARPLKEETTIEVAGRDQIAGLPRRAVVGSEEIREALGGPVGVIIDAIKSCLEQTPPELAADLVDRGIMMAGGGAMLVGLDRAIAEITGLPVRIAEEPMTAVANGTAVLLERSELLKRILKVNGSPDGF